MPFEEKTNRAGSRSSSKLRKNQHDAEGEQKSALSPLNPMKALNRLRAGNVRYLKFEVMDYLISQTNNKTRRPLRPLSYSRIAGNLDCCKAAVIEAVNELVATGWLIRIRNRAADGDWLSNTYEIRCDIEPGQPFERPPNGRRRNVKKSPARVRHIVPPEFVPKPAELEPTRWSPSSELVESVPKPAAPEKLMSKPAELAPKPAAESVELAETWEVVERERVMLMDELGRDPGHPDEPPREKRDEVSKSLIDLTARAKQRGIPQMQGDPRRFVVRVMLAEWLRWRGSDSRPTYLIDRGHSLFCLPGDMARLRVWFSRKYLEQKARASPPPMQEERRRPRVILETPFSDEDRSALEALKKVLKPPLGEAAPNSGEKTAKPESFVRPGCEYPTAAGVCAAHAVDMLEVAEKVYRATCQAHKHALWYLPNEPSSPAGGGGSDE